MRRDRYRKLGIMADDEVFVLDFQDIGAGALAKVGGKGANLAWMAQAGLPVPPGFCVTTAAFRRFVGREIEPLYAALDALDPGDVEGARVTAGRVRVALRALPIPPEVRRRRERLARAVRPGPRMGRSFERHGRGLAWGLLRSPAGRLPEHPR